MIRILLPLLAFGFGLVTLSAAPPPNIVLIFADDLGYGDVACYGATKVKTPHIDQLAAEGRRFTDAHSASAVCTPSRYALISGEYPLRANDGRGIWGPCGPTSPLLIDPKRPTIAKVLKEKAYETACFGKWHLGFGDGNIDWNGPLRPGPLECGFDYYFGLPIVNSLSPYVYVENDRIFGLTEDDPIVFFGRGAQGGQGKTSPITPLRKEHGGRVGNWFGGALESHKRYNDFTVGETLAKRAAAWIEARDDDPFFLYLATTHIHHPCTPGPRFEGTSDCGLYGDFIHELDWMVGELMRALEKKGVTKDTLVIFTSDNGGMFNENGQDAFAHGHRNNGDLLGFKFGAWEGGHRVPFIARWPGRIKAGSTSSQLVCAVDMLATFAAVSGQPLDPSETADSVNILPALTGDPETPVRDHLLLAPAKPTHLSLRKGKWMLIDAQGSGGFSGTKPGGHGFAGPAAATFSGHPNSDIVDGKLKADAPPAQLYDLEADVNQTRNLILEHPEVAEEMRAMLNRIKAENAARAKAHAQRHVAKKIPAAPSTFSACFDFESGTLAPWKVVDGEFGNVIGSRESIATVEAYNKQGAHYLTTLEVNEDGSKRSDLQTGTLVSPLFIPKGGPMTFRVGGGKKNNLFIALCTEAGEELLRAGGANQHLMQNATWNLTPYTGKKMFLKVVDEATQAWAHITVDHIEFDGEILDAYPVLAEPQQAEANQGAGWTDLLAGDSLALWEPGPSEAKTKSTEIGNRWSIKDGVVHLDRDAKEGRGGQIWTKKSYKDFDLTFEFNIAHDGNSGIKYRAADVDGRAIGCEYQIIDDDNYRDNKNPTHRTACLYELVAVPADRKWNPAGEWNSGRIRVANNMFEHWLNGVKVVSIEFGSDDWKARFAESKYKVHPDFARQAGPIVLTDHSDTVSYRNLRIRELNVAADTAEQ